MSTPTRPSAIEQAKKMFNRIVDLKINRAPLPINKQRIYPVATLGDGIILLSDGTTKIAPVYKEKEKLVQKDENIIGQTNSVGELVENAPLRMAIPVEQLGKGEDRMFAFVNYLGKLLQPQMAQSPEMGLPAMLPAIETDQKFQVPFALANLPSLTPAPQEVVESKDFFQRFIRNAQNVQDELRKDFLVQQGEKEAYATSVDAIRRLPLIRGYTETYRLPTTQNAGYAQIGTGVNAFNQRI